MRNKPTVSLVALFFVLTACEGSGPTDVAETALTPAGDGAVRTEWQEDIDFGTFTYAENCINDGQGEVVDGRHTTCSIGPRPSRRPEKVIRSGW